MSWLKLPVVVKKKKEERRYFAPLSLPCILSSFFVFFPYLSTKPQCLYSIFLSNISLSFLNFTCPTLLISHCFKNAFVSFFNLHLPVCVCACDACWMCVLLSLPSTSLHIRWSRWPLTILSGSHDLSAEILIGWTLSERGWNRMGLQMSAGTSSCWNTCVYRKEFF